MLPGLREKARQELIEEQVKIQEAKRVGVNPDEADVDNVVKEIAGRNKMTPAQFTVHFAGMGVDISTLKARFRSQQAWSQAVRRRFGHLVQPDNREIDRLVQKEASGEDQLELQIQRIVVPIPPKVDQKSMAQRYADAEALQRQFGGCKSTNALAAKIKDARFENLGPAAPAISPSRSAPCCSMPRTRRCCRRA